MKNNKGFTFVELLTTIVILGIVLFITVSIVTNVINNFKHRVYEENENAVIKAVQLYLHEDFSLFPRNIGNSTEVSIGYLKENNYLKRVKDPNNKSKECGGYVVVTKIDDNKYDYVPHIKCGDAKDINSSEEDGLVLHLPFDDFEEPTINLAQHKFDFYAPYHTVLQEGTKFTFHMIGVNRYLVIRNTSFGALKGRTFSFSGYMSKNGKPYIPKDKRFSSYNKIGDISNYEIDPETGYFSGTMYVSHETTVWMLHWPVVHQDGDIIVIDNFQIEEKEYPTAYTPTERTSVLYDRSGNDNHGYIELETSPQWISDSAVGKGAYHFSGNNTYITVEDDDSLSITDEFTLSLWVKYEGNFVGGVITKGQQGGWINNPYVLRATSNVMRMYLSDGTVSNEVRYSKEIGDNQWHYLTAQLAPDKLKLYLDGEFYAESNRTIEKLRVVNSPLRIGQGHTSSFYKGSIDDVRIFNRALSEDEIRYIYASTKK